MATTTSIENNQSMSIKPTKKKSYITIDGEQEEVIMASFHGENLSLADWKKARVLSTASYGGGVYLGIPTKPHLATVAIKSAPFNDSAPLVREEFALAKLRPYPHIVRSIGYTHHTRAQSRFGIYNLVLEHTPTGTLADLIQARTNNLPHSLARRYLRTILQGLSSVHATGYVHCDLKPDNILAFPSADGESFDLKISEFSLARWYRSTWRSDDDAPKRRLRFRGTPRYMSPESLTGEIKPALDVWSVGCVFVDMINGNKGIWNGCSTRKEVLSKLLDETATPDVPEELSAGGKYFLRKCFERNPKRRWTVDMLLDHPYLLERDEEEQILDETRCSQRLPFFVGRLCSASIVVVVLFIFVFFVLQ